MTPPRPRVWRVVLAAICLTSFLGLVPPAMAQSAGTLKVDPDTSSGAIVLTWTGPMASPMASQISTAFNQLKHQARYVIFRISSGGGSVAEGERVIEVFREIKKTHQLETVVEQGRTCGSMCVFVYLQGQTRTAALSSLWLFHEVSHSDPATQKIVRLDRAAWERLVNKYYASAGVSAEWTEKMKPYTIQSDFWQTGADLISGRSGIIHVALGNQKERLIADKPKPTPRHIAQAPTPPSEPPRVADKPPASPPRGQPPAASPPKRVAVQYETKECRRLQPELNIYVNVPCAMGAMNE